MNRLNHYYPIFVIFFIGLFLFVSFSSNAQEDKTNLYYYDFYKKRLYQDNEYKIPVKRPVVVWEGEEIQIEISKFNPLKYGIVIEDTSYYQFPLNVEEFPTNFVGANILFDSLKDDKSEKKYQIIELSTNTCKTVIQEKYKKLLDLNDSLEHGIESYNTLIRYIKNINIYHTYLKNLETIDTSIVESGIETHILKPLKSYTQRNEIGNTSSMVMENVFLDLEEDYYNDIIQWKDTMQALKSDFETQCKTCTSKVFKENKDVFNRKYDEMQSQISEFGNFRKNSVLPSLETSVLLYKELQVLAVNPPVVVTKSYVIDKDIHIIKIYRYDPVKEKKSLYDEINIRSTGGLRLNVSGGMFISRLHDDTYLAHTDSTGSVQFYLKPDIKFSYGGMMFLHVYPQLPGNIKIGWYIGMGAMFNKETRPVLSGGLSLLLGEAQRFTINIGIAASQVNRLKQPYEVGKQYAETFDEIPMDVIWDANILTGFSWKINK